MYNSLKISEQPSSNTWEPTLNFFYFQFKKISEQPCSNGDPISHVVMWEVIRTVHKLILRVPHGSRPHENDRNLVMFVNDPEHWQSIPVLQSRPWPDEDLSLVVTETYFDTPGSELRTCTDDRRTDDTLGLVPRWPCLLALLVLLFHFSTFLHPTPLKHDFSSFRFFVPDQSL